MIYHFYHRGRRNSYFIKYSDNIMIYHYIIGKEEILTSLNILIISKFITISQAKKPIGASELNIPVISWFSTLWQRLEVFLTSLDIRDASPNRRSLYHKQIVRNSYSIKYSAGTMICHYITGVEERLTVRVNMSCLRTWFITMSPARSSKFGPH